MAKSLPQQELEAMDYKCDVEEIDPTHVRFRASRPGEEPLEYVLGGCSLKAITPSISDEMWAIPEKSKGDRLDGKMNLLTGRMFYGRCS